MRSLVVQPEMLRVTAQVITTGAVFCTVITSEAVAMVAPEPILMSAWFVMVVGQLAIVVLKIAVHYH